MLVREYKDGDKSSLIAFLEMQHDTMTPFDPFGRQRKDGYGERSIENLLKENVKTGKIFVAVEDGKIVGYASGWIKTIEDFPNLTGAPNVNGMFDNIFVLPEYRRKGVASALVKKLEEYFQENRCQLVWLNVYSGNAPALNFYNKLGYSPNATTLIKKLR